MQGLGTKDWSFVEEIFMIIFWITSGILSQLEDWLSLLFVSPWGLFRRLRVLDLDNNHKESAIVSSALVWSLLLCGFSSVLAIWDRWIEEVQFFPSGDNSGVKVTGVLLFFKTVHKNSIIGRRAVHAFTFSEVVSKSLKTWTRIGMRVAGSRDPISKIVFVTRGGTKMIFLQSNLEGFLAATLSASKVALLSDPFRSAHLGTSCSKSLNKLDLFSL